MAVTWQAQLAFRRHSVKLTGAPFNDAYCYVDWLLTAPLLLIEHDSLPLRCLHSLRPGRNWIRRYRMNTNLEETGESRVRSLSFMQREDEYRVNIEGLFLILGGKA